MENLVKNLRILWRSEKLVAEVEFKTQLRKVILLVAAVLIFLAALAMIDLALFLWLQEKYGGVSAGLIMAGGNMIAGILLLVIAAQQKTGPETAMVREVRDLALAEIEDEARAVQKDLAALRQEVVAVGETVTNIARDPVGTLAPSVLVPLMSGVLKGVTKTKK